jgi:hypothetical protein
MAANQKKLDNIVWISWEKQRRSITLASLLCADYLELNYESNQAWLRYIKSMLISLIKIVGNRSSIIIVQNPSMILAVIATMLGKMLNIRIIVDRHTDRYILKSGSNFFYRIFLPLSDFTIKSSNITIVTNKELVDAVKNLNGTPFVLPDPFPDIRGFVKVDNLAHKTSKISCLVVASWFEDEPLEQIFEAARLLPNIKIFVSGLPKKEYSGLINTKPDNIHITNYLSDADFYTLMYQCDFVVAITTDSATLVCGGYEAITLSKPLLTGNSISLRNYFDDSAIYTDSSVEDIVKCMKLIVSNLDLLRDNALKLYKERSRQWEVHINSFKSELEAL